MPSAITKIGIINRGLQLLGQPSISSLNENSRGARSMIRAYDSIFLSELEANTWGFSIRRANLAADATAPVNGNKSYYPLPADFLYMAPQETSLGPTGRIDYDFENFNDTLCVVSGLSTPLEIRYVSSSTTESVFSGTFAEAFATALALACCEDITDSGSKKMSLERGYKDAVQRAKKRNDIQRGPTKSPTCSWISVRD